MPIEFLYGVATGLIILDMILIWIITNLIDRGLK